MTGKTYHYKDDTTRIQRVKWYSNGLSVKLPNKSITVSTTRKNDGIIITTKMFDVSNANKPGVLHTCHKGVVKQTDVMFSFEAMEIIIAAYIQIKEKGLTTKI